MLDRYEKAIMEKLLDIMENENLRQAPAGRIIELDDQNVFSIIAKLFGEEIAMTWHDDKGEVFVTVTDWRKRWATTVDIFAAAMRSVVES